MIIIPNSVKTEDTGTFPATRAVSDEMIRLVLREDETEQDPFIALCIDAATQGFEDWTNRNVIQRTRTLTLSAFPGQTGVIYPHYAPVSSITSIAYTDTNGDSQTLAASGYQSNLTAEPARIRPSYGNVWPTTRHDTEAAVTVTYVAGYGTSVSDVPANVQMVIANIAAHMYRVREPSDRNMAGMPYGLQVLIEQLRII